MSEIWDTKDGRRRVRRDPPTVEEAVLAAQGLTDELGEQIEIVASLMEVPPTRRGAPFCEWASARTSTVSPSPAGPARRAPSWSSAARCAAAAAHRSVVAQRAAGALTA